MKVGSGLERDGLDCARFNELIDDYVNGTVDDGLRRSIDRHAAACGACAAELRLMVSSLEDFSGQVLPDPGPSFTDAVMARVTAAEAAHGIETAGSRPRADGCRVLSRPASDLSPRAGTTRSSGLDGGLPARLWERVAGMFSFSAPLPARLVVTAAAFLFIAAVVSRRGQVDIPGKGAGVRLAGNGDVHSSGHWRLYRLDGVFASRGAAGRGQARAGAPSPGRIKGKPLSLGESYEVGAGGHCTLALSGGAGTIRFEGPAIFGPVDAGLEMSLGTARFDLDLKGRRFDVRTGNGTISVWGTSFEVRADTGATLLRVFHGVVRFRHRGRELFVQAGKAARAAGGFFGNVPFTGADWAGRSGTAGVKDHAVDAGEDRGWNGGTPPAGLTGVNGPSAAGRDGADLEAGTQCRSSDPLAGDGGPVLSRDGQGSGATGTVGGARPVDVDGGDDLDRPFNR